MWKFVVSTATRGLILGVRPEPPRRRRRGKGEAKPNVTAFARPHKSPMPAEHEFEPRGCQGCQGGLLSDERDFDNHDTAERANS